MTVEELIIQLQAIENKTKTVYFDDEEWGIRLVNEVVEPECFSERPVVLKSWN